MNLEENVLLYFPSKLEVDLQTGSGQNVPARAAPALQHSLEDKQKKIQGSIILVINKSHFIYFIKFYTAALQN